MPTHTAADGARPPGGTVRGAAARGRPDATPTAVASAGTAPRVPAGALTTARDGRQYLDAPRF